MFFDGIEIKKELNKKWSQMYVSKNISIPLIPLNQTQNSFFCIGSCFAEHVRKSLEQQLQKNCYPDYRNLQIDKDNEMVDTLNFDIYHMSHYTISSIKQEFARALGMLSEELFVPVKVDNLNIVNGQKLIEEDTFLYQDPYRREVFARDEQSCKALSKRITATVLDGIQKANTFIITLGLVELFIDEVSGLSFNQYPGYMGIGYSSPTLKFYRANYNDIVSDLREVIAMIKKVNPKNSIIFSVSPVPLQLTFTAEDVFTANMYSKSVLRAAVQQVIAYEDGIYYFPSLEIANNIGSDFFQERDLRHVKYEYVNVIMDIFLKSINQGSY